MGATVRGARPAGALDRHADLLRRDPAVAEPASAVSA